MKNKWQEIQSHKIPQSKPEQLFIDKLNKLRDNPEEQVKLIRANMSNIEKFGRKRSLEDNFIFETQVLSKETTPLLQQDVQAMMGKLNGMVDRLNVHGLRLASLWDRRNEYGDVIRSKYPRMVKWEKRLAATAIVIYAISNPGITVTALSVLVFWGSRYLSRKYPGYMIWILFLFMFFMVLAKLNLIVHNMIYH